MYRTFGEKETYTYLGILEAETIKHLKNERNHFLKMHQEDEKTTGN